MEENLRLPPQSLEAEQALLGAILTNNRAIEKVVEFLRPEHFANVAHQKIYSACLTLTERGRLADPITLKEFFQSDGSLEEVGGLDYISQLANASTTIINAPEYGQQIFDRHIRRQLIDIGTNVVNDAFTIDIENDSQKQIENAEMSLYRLATQTETEGGPKAFALALSEAIKKAEVAIQNPNGLSGTPTGLTDMDKQMGGLHGSDLIIIAGRPAMGKTSLATCIAFNIAKHFQEENKKEGTEKKSVAFFSLEMSADQLAERMLSTYTHIDSQSMRKGQITGEQFDQIAGAATLLTGLPLYIDETPGVTVSTIRNRARRLKREKGLGLIVIDYLQLIAGGGRSESRVQELSEMTRGLKIMAKELNVPVIVLSQLSRLVEQRDNKRPQLSDLRESGSIEQDADIVMFVYREAYYLEQERPVIKPKETNEMFAKRCAEWEQKKIDLAHTAEAIIAKQRHGPTGSVHLYFDGQFTEFGNLEKTQAI
ncbi:MAG: replicative DNA helicase [Alphaproteobacteria bacterium]|nr:replicative DNA helicase [Alphaproteobacteria bacterium]